MVLARILRELWAAGYRLGWDSADQILAPALAIELEADAGQLARLLAEAGSRVDAMAETRLSQIEGLLTASVSGEGSTVTELESGIEEVLGSDAAALAVTQSETTWSMAEGMLGYYFQAGTQTVSWLTAQDERVCYVCDSNESDGSVPIGQAFASGDTQPPAHTRCRCCLVPDDILGTPLPY